MTHKQPHRIKLNSANKRKVYWTETFSSRMFPFRSGLSEVDIVFLLQLFCYHTKDKYEMKNINLWPRYLIDFWINWISESFLWHRLKRFFSKVNQKVFFYRRLKTENFRSLLLEMFQEKKSYSIITSNEWEFLLAHSFNYDWATLYRVVEHVCS